jgi:hypothetical protein
MSEILVSKSTIYGNEFEYRGGNMTYWLRKVDSNGLELWRESDLTDVGKKLTYERVWALMLTEEAHSRDHRLYLVKVIYSGILHIETINGGNSQIETIGLEPISNEDVNGPEPPVGPNDFDVPTHSSGNMQTHRLFGVKAQDWEQFVTVLKEWAAQNFINLVYDYER